MIFSCLQEDLTHDHTPGELRYRPGHGSVMLARLCLVSKGFRGVAQSILYHSIPVQDKRTRLLLFRTLSQQPSLGLLVKRITLEASSQLNHDFKDVWAVMKRQIVFPTWFKKQIQDALDLVFSSENPTFFRDHLDTMQDVELTMFLVLVPKIERLSITLPGTFYRLRSAFYHFTSPVPTLHVPGTPRSPYRGGRDLQPRYDFSRARNQPANTITILSPSPRDHTPLSCLQHLHVGSCDAKSMVMMQHLIPGLVSPALKKLSCHMVDFKDCMDQPLPTIPGGHPSPLKLESIELKHSLINAPDLRDFLHSCGGGESLHTLRIHWSEELKRWIGVGEIGVALHQYASSLRVLELNTYDGISWIEPYQMAGVVGSLKTLRHLKALEINHGWLVGMLEEDGLDGFAINLPENWPALWELLPASLEHLHLTFCELGDPVKTREDLSKLFYHGHFPKLKTVRASKHPELGVWEVEVRPNSQWAIKSFD